MHPQTQQVSVNQSLSCSRETEKTKSFFNYPHRTKPLPTDIPNPKAGPRQNQEQNLKIHKNFIQQATVQVRLHLREGSKNDNKNKIKNQKKVNGLRAKPSGREHVPFLEPSLYLSLSFPAFFLSLPLPLPYHPRIKK